MNIILITADTLKEKTIKTQKKYIPNIEFLKKNGFCFSNNFVCSPWTGPSFASFFTGVYPNEHSLQINIPKVKDSVNSTKTEEELLDGSFKFEFEKQFTKFLRKTHYCMGIQGNLLCTEDFGFGKYFHEYTVHFKGNLLMKTIFRFSAKIKLYKFLMKIKKIKDNALKKLSTKKAVLTKSKTAEVLAEDAIKKIGENKNKEFFLWVNFMDMHSPYTDICGLEEKPEYKKIDKTKSELFNLTYNLENKLTETEKKFVTEKYDSNIRIIDKGIGKIIECLKENSLFEKTAIIFTSDHGEEFWEHGKKRNDEFFYNRGVSHGHTVYNELIKVPLILFYPSLGSKKIEKLTSCVNIYNTIFELAGIQKDSELPPSILDISLNKAEMDYVISEYLLYGKETKGIIDKNNFKLIKGIGNKRTELYDLKKDPEEKKEISGTNEKKVKELARKMLYHM